MAAVRHRRGGDFCFSSPPQASAVLLFVADLQYVAQENFSTYLDGGIVNIILLSIPMEYFHCLRMVKVVLL